MKQNSKKKAAYLATIILIGILAGGKKVIELSADPKGEKECPPLFPSQSDPSKTNNLEIKPSGATLPWLQKGGTINDASCLDQTQIYGIIQPTTVEEIRDALAFARERKLKVSLAGVRHSMGGQAFSRGALVLDMTKFNQIAINEAGKTMRVQAGATWHDIQEKLHPKFAVKAMQSTDIFTVGGSISVNAHGMDHQVGALGKTIRSLRIMHPDGTIETVSRANNPRLFNLLVGGYGLFGIILDAELEISENTVYQSERKVTNYKEFPELFTTTLLPDKSIGLMYVHLSTAPHNFLKEIILYTYRDVGVTDGIIPPLGEVAGIKFRRFVFNLAKTGSIPARLKWLAEKYIEPRLEVCPVSRNQAMTEGEACLVARNEPMHDSVKYLKNNLVRETDILQEYFIPRSKFLPFVDELREVLTRNNANTQNASVRVVHKENNFLNYAPEDSFSIVLYLNQKTDAAGNAHMARLTSELIDLTHKHGGRFFLPYQLHYSAEQLKASYPEIIQFFAAKKEYDPNLMLTNTFYEKYASQILN